MPLMPFFLRVRNLPAVLPAVLLVIFLVGFSGCSAKNETPSGGSQRSAEKNRFVQNFAKECLVRIPASADLSQVQQQQFCQCMAEAMADNNTEEQLHRYIAGQDRNRLKTDGENYGKPCLAQAYGS